MYKKTWSDYSSYFSAKSLIAGFTNKHFPHSSSNDRIEFAKILKLNYEKLIIPQQIHSGNVTICNESGQLLDTDGIITNNKIFVLSLQVADCIPLYLSVCRPRRRTSTWRRRGPRRPRPAGGKPWYGG